MNDRAGPSPCPDRLAQRRRDLAFIHSRLVPVKRERYRAHVGSFRAD
jgi:hypothetical protein